MDPLAHALFGGALASSPFGRRSPLSAAALVIGAMAPDLDLLAWPIGGRDAWMKVQSGLTHSPLGLVLLALALVPFLRWVEREFLGRHSVFSAGGRPSTCGPALIVGLATHLPLDLLTDRGARPGLPFSDAWIRGDLVHPTDPWLWLIFGSAAALAGPRSNAGSALLALCAILGLGLIGQHENAPAWLPWVWGVGCAGLAWTRAAGVGRKRSKKVLARAAGLAALYLCLLGAARLDSAGRARAWLAEHEPQATLASVHPRFGRPLAWTAFAVGPNQIVKLDIRWRGELQAAHVPHEPGDPLVQTSLRLTESEAWRKTARHPLGRIEAESDGGAWVELSDAAEEGRPWDRPLRWRHRFPPEEVTRIRALFEAAERAERR